MNENMFKSNEFITLSVLEEFEEDKQVIEKFKEFLPKRKEIIENLQIAQGNFNVILHNDAWCNNFMFK